MPDAQGTGDETPEKTPEQAEYENIAAVKSEFSHALANLIEGLMTRARTKQESICRVVGEGMSIEMFQGKAKGNAKAEAI